MEQKDNTNQQTETNNNQTEVNNQQTNPLTTETQENPNSRQETSLNNSEENGKSKSLEQLTNLVNHLTELTELQHKKMEMLSSNLQQMFDRTEEVATNLSATIEAFQEVVGTQDHHTEKLGTATAALVRAERELKTTVEAIKTKA